MKKVIMWPAPPISSKSIPPKIPDSFTCFGIPITVKDNMPSFFKTNKHKSFNKEKVRNYLDRSFNLFKHLVKNMIDKKDPTIIATELRNVHSEINEYFNSCRVEEAIKKIKLSISERNKEKKKMLYRKLTI
ncbi:hypothetical protein GVAV_002538 [Gurleya vavrai]